MSDVHTQGSYDLPSGYNDNRIVLLPRDPHWLFAYWEISNDKRNSFIRDFGQELWDKSFPVLKITNVSKNTSLYIKINDYTNNWYVKVEDANQLYVAELGRRVSEQFFINLASSNYAATPSDTVSANTTAHFINCKDLRSGRLEIDTEKIYETYNYKSHSAFISGISSPEIMRMSLQQSILGISSAELFGINLAEHLGVSSEILIK